MHALARSHFQPLLGEISEHLRMFWPVGLFGQRCGSAALACIPASDLTEVRLLCLVIVLGLDLLLLLHRWLLALR